MSLDNTLSALRGKPAHRCPWWFGWALVSPVRRLFEDPERLLGTLVSPRSQVLEVGPGMGFFTTYLAERVGAEGHVYGVDVEERMLRALGRRLERHGLGERVTLRRCAEDSLGITDLRGTIDCAVLIHVLHELPDPAAALGDIAASLAPQGTLLLIEPKGHVTRPQFEAELALARQVGLTPVEPAPACFGNRPMAVVLERRGATE